MMAQQRMGGTISAIEAGGLGERLGLRAGDRLLSINGQPLRDVIDFRYYSADNELTLDVERDEQELVVSGERDFGEPMGIQFAHPTFDVDIRRCVNRCPFCFVTQSPPGMRRSLYVKDDDYRYSFLFGHFVTLTNLDQSDWQRIEVQHLSPLYVSVHATEPVLRAQLLGREGLPDVMDQLHWLQARDIQVHTQLVLLPGVNDGAHLERSLEDLVSLYPTVQSISIVPVGLTRFCRESLRPYRRDEARQLLAQVEPWRVECRCELGTTLIYPSDEWYLLARRTPPPATQYDGFGQLENGVGMVRQFVNDWRRLKGRLARQNPAGGWPLAVRRATLVCGQLAAGVLQQFADQANALLGCELHVLPVKNDWYGAVTTVSGLLTARDVLAALQADRDGRPEAVLLPRVMFDNAGQVTLDGKTLPEMSRTLGVPVLVAQHPDEVVAAVLGGSGATTALSPKEGWWGEQNRPFWQVRGRSE